MKLATTYAYRWLMAGAFIWILLSGVYFILLYWLVLLLSLEWLNSRKFYADNWRRLNWFFAGYLYFILLIRAIHWHWNLHFREVVNIVEHLLFAMLVCTLLFLGSLAVNVRLNLYKRMMGVYLLFNVVGCINEVYQNLVVGRLASAFVADSLKDIGVNLAGSLLAVLVLLMVVRQSSNFSTLTSPVT